MTVCSAVRAALAVLVLGAAPALSLLPPVVMVPGLTSSNLTIKLTNAPTKVSWCNTTTNEWHSLFPMGPEYGGLHYPCWLEDVSTFFDNTTRTFSSKPGANVTTVDFGAFDGDSLGPVMVPEFVAEGWTPGKDYFDAPYDWRFPSAGLESYYLNLQALVEKAYENTKTKVAIFAVSYGPQIALGFLHRMSQQWKDAYIRLFMAVSPVWSGSPSALGDVVAGFLPSGYPQSPNILLRNAWNLGYRTHSSTWLFPRAGSTNTTWGRGEWLVKTPSKAYTAFDMVELFTDLGYQALIPSLQFLQSEPDLGAFAPPGVDTFVTYGFAVPTAGSFEFAVNFTSPPDTIEWQGRIAKINYPDEAGDGIVSLRSSLRGMEAWPGSLDGKNLYYKGYFNQTHAMCILAPVPGQPDDHCFTDMITALKLGTFPSDAHHFNI